MRYGLALPYLITNDIQRLSRLAEETGWDGIFLGDAIWTDDPMIALTAAALATERIRLGPLVIPVPLRRPWKLASEALALDRLSNGRLTLGLGAGAAWMGWYAFPDEPTETKTRAQMLDETLDILTLLFRGKPFDYDGEQYHVRLTQLPEEYYPPLSVQRPRIPLWVPAQFPHHKPLARALKADGVIVEKLGATGEPEPPTPDDVRAMRAFVEAERELTTPFDIVVVGKTQEMGAIERQDTLAAWKDAGVTWWVEDLFGGTVAEVEAFAVVAAS